MILVGISREEIGAGLIGIIGDVEDGRVVPRKGGSRDEIRIEIWIDFQISLLIAALNPPSDNAGHSNVSPGGLGCVNSSLGVLIALVHFHEACQAQVWVVALKWRWE